MKTCAYCHRSKPLSEFGRNAVNFKQGARDGKNIYCKKCARLGTSLRRRKMLPVLDPHFKPRSCRIILNAITKGEYSREGLQRETRLNEDEIADVLAHLVFEKRKLKIVRIGERREFHIAA